MHHLLAKDLRILARSPLLVGLLVVYPIAIAVLIGVALSRGPDKPRVAIVNEVPASASEVDLGGQRIDLSKQTNELFDSVEPVPVKSRAEAIQRVEDGDVLGAVIIPRDITRKIQSTLQPGTILVYYNAEDPAKKQFVQNTIDAEVEAANRGLTRQVAKEALDLLELISQGGQYAFLGRSFDVLGLQRSERILEQARRELPRGSPERAEVGRVIAFARLAQDNLSFSDDVLGVVASPLRVDARVVEGGSTELSSFAVAVAVSISLMFVTLLLASAALALEREEHAFTRLVRGLVSRSGLLLEKAGLAAVCSLGTTILMLLGLSLFVDLDVARLPLWVAAGAVAALAFAALGLAIGAVAREVRAASLMAIMLSLPLAFLALVPSGAVAPALYDAIQVVSAIFPFEPTLDAMDAAVNDSGGLGGPLLHLAALFLGFGAISRLALRRFA